MKTATINVKTEVELKKRAQAFAKSAGLSLSDLVNLSLRQSVSQGRVVIEEPLIPNSKTAKVLRQALKEIKQGKNLVGPFNSVKEMDDYLNTL